MTACPVCHRPVTIGTDLKPAKGFSRHRPSTFDSRSRKGLRAMTITAHLTQQSDRLDLTEPDALSRLISSVDGAGDRGRGRCRAPSSPPS